MSGPVLEAAGICKSFGVKEVLKDLDLSMDRGELVALVGPSGSGKTTLLRILNGLTKPDIGQVSVMGEVLRFCNGSDLSVRRRMSYLSQKPVALRSTVWDNVAYPLRLRGFTDVDRRVSGALEHVSLMDMRDRPACTLSGGELQRMAFARATVYEPEILLLDEFTAHLDPYNITVLERAVKDYLEERGAVVMVTHNLFQAKRISSSAAFLFDGRIVEKGATASFFEYPEDERTLAFVNGEMVF